MVVHDGTVYFECKRFLHEATVDPDCKMVDHGATKLRVTTGHTVLK